MICRFEEFEPDAYVEGASIEEVPPEWWEVIWYAYGVRRRDVAGILPVDGELLVFVYKGKKPR